MQYLDALLKKQDVHDIVTIDFHFDTMNDVATVGYDGMTVSTIKAQQQVIHTIAATCPDLQTLHR
jgi:hypothetical protein